MKPRAGATIRERSAVRRYLEKTAQWFAAAFLFACCLGVVALALMIAANGPLKSWLAAVALLCLAGALAWLSWRALSAPLFPKIFRVAQDGSSIVTAELVQHSPWPERISPPVLAEEINQLMASGHGDQALSVIEGLAGQVPSNLMLRFWKAAAFVSAGRLTEAETVLANLVEQSDVSPVGRAELLVMRLWCVFRLEQSERVAPLVEAFLGQSPPPEASIRVLDYLACVPFTEDRKSYLAEAEKWSQRSLAIQPHNLTLKGTRGSLFVEMGRFDEAESLLKEVCAKSDADIDCGICSLYLAIIAKHRGEAREAGELATCARQTYPAQWLLERVQREFPKLG